MREIFLKNFSLRDHMNEVCETDLNEKFFFCCFLSSVFKFFTWKSHLWYHSYALDREFVNSNGNFSDFTWEIRKFFPQIVWILTHSFTFRLSLCQSSGCSIQIRKFIHIIKNKQFCYRFFFVLWMTQVSWFSYQYYIV